MGKVGPDIEIQSSLSVCTANGDDLVKYAIRMTEFNAKCIIKSELLCLTHTHDKVWRTAFFTIQSN